MNFLRPRARVRLQRCARGSQLTATPPAPSQVAQDATKSVKQGLHKVGEKLHIVDEKKT
jgi:hypothetical protein